MAGPSSGGRPYGASFGPQWTDNVGRMRDFMKAHPEVEVTVPAKNGTDEFIATCDGEKIASDRSLGWLMDHLEGLFRDGGR